MIETKKCMRCGCMYISGEEVCGKCRTKDGADLYRLKGILKDQEGEVFTKGELSIASGISNKNLTRFLAYDEFKGVCDTINKDITTGKTGTIVEA